MAEVKVRGATVEVRSLKLTKALLKQVRRVQWANLGPDWWIKEGDARELNPDRVLGWFHGSVLGDEWTRFVLLVHDGDLFLLDATGQPKLERRFKQLYIG